MMATNDAIMPASSYGRELVTALTCQIGAFLTCPFRKLHPDLRFAAEGRNIA
jgi:hypothetical protein